jgi:L-lactate dehydrogenase complex protein LldG
VSAREELLSRIRRALVDRPSVTVVREYRRTGEASLELFVERVADYRALVHHVVERELPELLAEVAQGRVVVPDGLPAEWLTALNVLQETALTPQQLDTLDAVVTTCAVAIAETGTIVLDGGPGQGRRAITLVPDHHVVVVRPDQVVARVPQALARLEPGRPQTWISGPSATSDIELQRVEGVHGPRRLDVVLLSA